MSFNLALSNTPRAIHPVGVNEIIEDPRTVSRYQKIHIELSFELAEPVAPWTLRVNILPLVLETSSTEGMFGAYIAITYPEARDGEIIRAEQRINPRKLRHDVIVALKDLLDKNSDGTNLRQPGIWIDGFGEITDTVDAGVSMGFKVIPPAHRRLFRACGIRVRSARSAIRTSSNRSFHSRTRQMQRMTICGGLYVLMMARRMGIMTCKCV